MLGEILSMCRLNDVAFMGGYERIESIELRMNFDCRLFISKSNDSMVRLCCLLFRQEAYTSVSNRESPLASTYFVVVFFSWAHAFGMVAILWGYKQRKGSIAVYNVIDCDGKMCCKCVLLGKRLVDHLELLSLRHSKTIIKTTKMQILFTYLYDFS